MQNNPNIEILEGAGEGNFFLFGLTEEQVELIRHHYNPCGIIQADEDIKKVIDL